MKLTQRQVRLLLGAVDEYLDANEDLCEEGSNAERREWTEVKYIFGMLEKELLRTARLSPVERVQNATKIEVLSEVGTPPPLTPEQQEQLKTAHRITTLERSQQAQTTRINNLVANLDELDGVMLKQERRLDELATKFAAHVGHSVRH